MASCLSCMCRRTSEDDDMRQESTRLASLDGCRALQRIASTLALQGFYFVAHPDEVQCFFCGIRLSTWDDDDDPLREHLRNSNMCPLLRGAPNENVPINQRVMQKFLRNVQQRYPNEQRSPFCWEAKRLESFDDWPGEDAAELARHGFFYTGSEWDVECIFCYMRIDMQPPTGDTLTRHMNGNCPLFRGRDSTNVPLDCKLTHRLIYELAGQRPSSDYLVFPAERHNTQDNTMPPRDPRRVTVISNPLSERYVHPPQIRDLHVERNRLKSFRNWRGSVDKNELARQGFYYTGTDDTVQCIFCHVQLSNWHPESDIIDTHMNRRCPLMRGYDTANVPLTEIRDATPMRDSGCEEKWSEICNENDDRRCKICYENPYETVFLPCGHVAMCTRCASAVERCPFCQQPGQMARLYFM